MADTGYTTKDYRDAMGGEGPLAYQWKDKPHRLIYDLCREVEHLQSTPTPPRPGITNKWPKYRHGDYVRIADNLGSSMSHFQSGCNATVIGLDWKHDGTQPASYILHIDGYGYAAWYYEHQLTLIEAYHAPND